MLTDWPPGPGRAVDVDLQVALLDLDVHLLGLGHDGDRRRRRVDASLRLGLGHPLDAVRPALELEDRVGAVALDRVRRLLDPTRVARRHLDLLPAEAAPLGVALQQPREVSGPELPFVPALAAADLDDHVLLVGGVALGERELQLLLEPRDVGLVVADHLGELGVAFRRVEVLARLLPLLRELPRPFELLQAPPDVGRLTVVVVDRGVGHPLLRFRVGPVELRHQIVECRHRGLRLARELCVEADVGNPRQRLRHRAVLFRVVRGLRERGLHRGSARCRARSARP